MTVTFDLTGSTAFTDTSGYGAVIGPPLTKSITVVEQTLTRNTLATAGTLTVPFGSVAAGKVLIIKVSAGPVTIALTVNSVSSGNIRCNDLFVLVETGGAITGATVTQSTGSDVTVDCLVAGST